jgi:hypothetical protein
MLLGAALAGTAIENSMLGAAHAAANPLTARFGRRPWSSRRRDAAAVIATMLPMRRPRALYLEHATVVGHRSIEELISRVEELLALAGMRDSLQLNGELEPALPELAPTPPASGPPPSTRALSRLQISSACIRRCLDDTRSHPERSGRSFSDWSAVEGPRGRSGTMPQPDK